VGFGNVVEVLLTLLAQHYRQAECTEAKLDYYRIYEGFYWRLRAGPLAWNVNASHFHQESRARRKLRKALTVVYFLKLCECKTKRGSVLSPQPTFS